MKEEELKKIMGKSAIETSDDFINKLMDTIEKDQKVEKISFWWSFKPVLIVCSSLVLTITFFLYKFLSTDSSFLNLLGEVNKTPIFVMITLVFLYFINQVIKLNENLTD
ncbi:hypothetical protein [Aquimarina sp. 2201CG14-23]|uniref:hypothetical protein n=1 Tax=Aquimarina mycalae TaxID=3040073 RepID=UPI002477FB1A|nr:hypothetical protein [Aquimarina sp. 2201CG14-23]MDH7444379.1 hypothetical protein [Aquimarina sp. 2201CG14-23]